MAVCPLIYARFYSNNLFPTRIKIITNTIRVMLSKDVQKKFKEYKGKNKIPFEILQFRGNEILYPYYNKFINETIEGRGYGRGMTTGLTLLEIFNLSLQSTN